MKKVQLIVFCIIFCLLLAGCNNVEFPFCLSDEYYQNSTFHELNSDKLDDLVSDKKSFVIFIHQPFCSMSYDFDKILTEFVNEYQISFYKMSFTEMKETSLKKRIKYYPSLVIYHKGKVVDYLDANSNEDSECYRSLNGFSKWFFKYVKLERA